MCLYPRTILNPKFKPNKKNGGKPPVCTDERLRYIQIKCGMCLECRKQKKREWITRLSEEIRNDNQCHFMTLTIDDEHMKTLSEKYKIDKPNDIATKAMRLYLELIRKHTKKSVKHWAITELGEKKGRIHLHGIFWGNAKTLMEKWRFGFTFKGSFVNEKTINYITKYMLKQNPYDLNFQGKVLCSKGIGMAYFEREDVKRHAFKGEKTKETYKMRNGAEVALPEYFKRKIWTEEEREKLRLIKDEKGIGYIMGQKYETADEYKKHNLLLTYQRLSLEIIRDNFDEYQKRKKIRKEWDNYKYIKGWNRKENKRKKDELRKLAKQGKAFVRWS